jgi:tRNA nucleotidyltransferase (CCA-adding enzyme)
MSEQRVHEIARALRAAGGRGLIVGGFVRDRVLGRESKDLDVEVFGLTLEQLEALLERFGSVVQVGRSFGVLRVKGLDVDFSLPRRDSKVGSGHRGFAVELDPGLDFAEAARRRDLTMNSMALDPLTGEILDPHGGRRDLEARVLRATDPERFNEDPLRALRVAQLAARFEMEPEPALLALCAQSDLGELPGERLAEEFHKLLLKGVRPSLGLRILEQCHLLRFFPEIAALVGVPQDPEWHPEGEVFTHTLMALDEAARLRDGSEDDRPLMWGVLCHDLGKPATTREEGGRVRSPAHDVGGIEPTRALLARMRLAHDLVEKVCALVEHHLAPALFVKQESGPKAYRRLARKLGAASVSVELLVRVARADHFGRTTEEALARRFPSGELFLERAKELEVAREAPRDVVMGRHLIERGLVPGPQFSQILERCREIQDERGWQDPARILDAALRADLPQQ